MQYVFGIFIMLVAAKGCEEQFDYSSIDYEASSRGIYHHIHVEGNTLIAEHTHDGSDKVTRSLTESEVNELNRLAQAFVVTTTDDVENPSDAANADAANADAAVPVKVLIVGGTYSRSAKFDRGNPPAKLAPLVTRLLLLAEKQ